MNCWSCGNELMWNNDYDIGDENEYFKLLTILTCPKCGSMVECYHERKEQEDEENS
jgi:predicted RNA-binding Zn-ribbon protein involved in translation (DUF1610 family)